MSDSLYFFDNSGQHAAVMLPYDIDEVIRQWGQLRVLMTREVPDAFSRDEWAYLVAFLDPFNLEKPFLQAFGQRQPAGSRQIDTLLRPRGQVAVWLPNNVSLLGPLVMILVSLTGNRMRFKAGSRADDLTNAFVDYARSRVDDGPLKEILTDRLHVERFDRLDPRNARMAAESQVRLLFGSDAAVSAIESLPHPIDSTAFSFAERVSEAWLETDRTDRNVLTTLIKVFAIYGRAGCTSPRRVVLLDGTSTDASRVRDELVELWPSVIRRDPPMHIATQNIMAQQLAAATGWDATLVPRHGAVLCAGGRQLEPVPGLMTLGIVPISKADVTADLPANIQTIGHAVDGASREAWIEMLIPTNVKRFVPLERMHHFGPIWDGWSFWKQTFEEIEFSL